MLRQITEISQKKDKTSDEVRTEGVKTEDSSGRSYEKVKVNTVWRCGDKEENSIRKAMNRRPLGRLEKRCMECVWEDAEQSPGEDLGSNVQEISGKRVDPEQGESG